MVISFLNGCIVFVCKPAVLSAIVVRFFVVVLRKGVNEKRVKRGGEDSSPTKYSQDDHGPAFG